MSSKPLSRAMWLRATPLAIGFSVAALALGASPAQAQVRDAAFAPAPSELSASTLRAIQAALIDRGYGLSNADGVWGPQTAAALREFQRSAGLPTTGRPDAGTLSALGIGSAGPVAVAPNAAPPAGARTPADLGRVTLRAIQQALARQGFQTGAADGMWGERTRSAIGNFQRAHGMPASGDLDVVTLAALGFLPFDPQYARAHANGQPPSAAMLDPAAVRMIQQALRASGVDVAVDGQWGDRTADACREFQRVHGLDAMGEPDVYTLAALGLLPGTPRPVYSAR